MKCEIYGVCGLLFERTFIKDFCSYFYLTPMCLRGALWPAVGGFGVGYIV